MLPTWILALSLAGGLIASLEQKLTAPGGEPSGFFAGSVCIQGDIMIVGSPSEQVGGQYGAGAVHVYERSGTWVHVHRLTADAPKNSAQFGTSVGLAGDRIVVGAPGRGGGGRIHLFERKGPSWSEVAVLQPHDSEVAVAYGYAVAIDGNTVVTGASGDDTLGTSFGAIYVYSWSGSDVSFQTKLYESGPVITKGLGASVALSNGTLVAGATFGKGAAYVFVNGPAGWTQEAALTAPDGKGSDFFGKSVAISGDRIVVGADGDDYGGVIGAGSAYVFERGAQWQFKTKLTPSKNGTFQKFGLSVALDGELILIGARSDPNWTVGGGAAYLFSRVAGQWVQQAKLKPQGTAMGDWLGDSVSLSGFTPVACAPRHLTNPDPIMRGAVYTFGLEAAPGATYCTAGTSASGCTATLSAAGTASFSKDSGFSLTASTVEGARPGLFFYGTNGGFAVPWGDGTSLQCVRPPATRLGLLSGAGTPGQCDGAFAQDLNATWCATCPKPSKNPGPGAVCNAQLWYRDPLNTSNQTTSLSDAIEFTVGP